MNSRNVYTRFRRENARVDLEDVDRVGQVSTLGALGSIVASELVETESDAVATKPKACLLGAGIDLLGLAGLCLFI